MTDPMTCPCCTFCRFRHYRHTLAADQACIKSLEWFLHAGMDAKAPTIGIRGRLSVPTTKRGERPLESHLRTGNERHRDFLPCESRFVSDRHTVPRLPGKVDAPRRARVEHNRASARAWPDCPAGYRWLRPACAIERETEKAGPRHFGHHRSVAEPCTLGSRRELSLVTNAEIHIGRDELEWAKAAEVGTLALPELYVAGIAAHPRLTLIEEGMEVFPEIHVVSGPGHSPGHMVFILSGQHQGCHLCAGRRQDARRARRADRRNDGRSGSQHRNAGQDMVALEAARGEHHRSRP